MIKAKCKMNNNNIINVILNKSYQNISKILSQNIITWYKQILQPNKRIIQIKILQLYQILNTFNPKSLKLFKNHKIIFYTLKYQIKQCYKEYKKE
jgi:hypothetical protein